METWQNGDSAKRVKEAIDNNFEILNKRINSLQTNTYTKVFTMLDWSNGIISIPYSEHNKPIPNVIALCMMSSEGSEPILGGYVIKNNTVELQSDTPYSGRVVII